MLNKGGHHAAAGTYWNLASGERVEMAVEGVLPGDAGVRYEKAPGMVVIAAAPILGLLFAIFLPFIGIAMAVSLAAKKLVEGLAGAAAGSMSFGWRPIEACLAGRKRKKTARQKNDKKS